MSDPHASDTPGHPAMAGADHHDEALGPIDVAAWGAGIAGVAISMAIAVCFALATSGLG